MKYLRPSAFAKKVCQHRSRISLLIALGRLKTKTEHGVLLIEDSKFNIKQAERKR